MVVQSTSLVHSGADHRPDDAGSDARLGDDGCRRPRRRQLGSGDRMQRLWSLRRQWPSPADPSSIAPTEQPATTGSAGTVETAAATGAGADDGGPRPGTAHQQ